MGRVQNSYENYGELILAWEEFSAQSKENARRHHSYISHKGGRRVGEGAKGGRRGKGVTVGRGEGGRG